MLKFNYMRKMGLAIVASLAFVACSEKEAINNEQFEEISQDVKSKFSEMGFDVSNIKTTGSGEMLEPAFESNHYLLEEDIVVTAKAFEEMLANAIDDNAPMEEQYRTNALVSNPRTVSVIGYTGGSNALDNTMTTALQWAVDNYNALNTGLNFTLTYGTNHTAYDIVVYKVSGAGGGQAGFPSGGDPYHYVQIQSGTSNYGTNVVEHVMTHEIGHSLGLRHTDYFNRSYSCGSGGNEGDGGVGAVHIPGTPTGVDANSVMLACFSASEDGEFGSYDRIALEYLY